MFLMGVACALNPCVAYVYVMEVVPKKDETLIITLTQIGEAIPTIVGPLYFMYVNTYWQPLIVMGSTISVISTVLVFWTIESPRYLLSSGQIKRC